MKQKRTYCCCAVKNRGRGWSESVGGVLEPAAGLAGLGALRLGRAAMERLWAACALDSLLFPFTPSEQETG